MDISVVFWATMIGGVLTLLACIFDWELVFGEETRGSRNMVDVLGRKGARIFWAVFAIGGMIVGFLLRLGVLRLP